ncbi:Reversal of tor2 lethality [Vermiconidia calcicola]|uniref:Reversal of tor2 lethality n=1 Tax=Vermiconidia calcicola TaxID=1690605 RepID=A0ACC3ML29_9PEZI|nr:Reversal of tor2 lethality [Vermiconidia calcicola]
MLLYYSLAAALPLLGLTNAQVASAIPGTYPTDLIGTWASKSKSVVTGPGFYDPLNDELLEPDLTGISYSFTADGHYEEAYYRAISNPTDPACPSGIMQWQHGSWIFNANGSLSLTPIEVDGRQLTSEPCNYDSSLYIRYNQTELFKQYSVYTDEYHNVPRLDLYMFDGTPMQPLYLVFSPPQMLPTTTLNPMTSASATAGAQKLKKRSSGFGAEVPLNWKASLEANQEAGKVVQTINADRLWWVGLGMTGIGGLLFFGPRRMGIQI